MTFTISSFSQRLGIYALRRRKEIQQGLQEEYQKRNGEIGERPYVYQVRSLAAIQSGDFKVPELKKLKSPSGAPAARPGGVSVPYEPYEYTNDDVPF